MRVLFSSFLLLALLGGLVGGTFATFSDTESSDDNTFQAGTLDFTFDASEVTMKLHPNEIRDKTATTNQGGGPISAENRAKFALSDDDRYTPFKEWPSGGFDTDRFIRFGFPGIPGDATVQSSKLNLEWRQSGLDAARLTTDDNGDDGSATDSLTLASTSTDTFQNVDVSSVLDQANEVGNSDVKFQAHGGSGTSIFDLMELEVTYTRTGEPLFELLSLEPGEAQSAIITLNSQGGLDGTATMKFKGLTGSDANSGGKSGPEQTDEDSSSEFVPEEVAAGDSDSSGTDDVDEPQRYIEVTIRYDTDGDGDFRDETPVDLSSFEDPGDSNAIVDLFELEDDVITVGTLPGSSSRQVEVTFNLDPDAETGNIYRKDKVEFDVELGLEQS